VSSESEEEEQNGKKEKYSHFPARPIYCGTTLVTKMHVPWVMSVVPQLNSCSESTNHSFPVARSYTVTLPLSPF